MTIRMYDLAGAEAERRFSPFCWRAKLALAHKELEAETIPWRYADKPILPQPNGGTVPVMIDGDTVLPDSWTIALHLERAYPDRPSLFGGEAALGVTHALNVWCDTAVHPTLSRLVVADIHAHVASQDKDYFRRTREARFGGKPLEEVQASRDTDVTAFRNALGPVRAALVARPFLGGTSPLYADYIVMGCFLWVRAVSRFEPLAPDDSVMRGWRERLYAAHPFVLRSPMH